MSLIFSAIALLFSLLSLIIYLILSKFHIHSKLNKTIYNIWGIFDFLKNPCLTNTTDMKVILILC